MEIHDVSHLVITLLTSEVGPLSYRRVGTVLTVGLAESDFNKQ